jgi:hypothetical protein
VIPYVSRTGTRTTLAALRKANWRLLVTASGVLRTEGFPYAIDNGAWSAYCQKKPFDHERFRLCVKMFGTGADFIVVPDIVAGGLKSLDFSREWLDELAGIAPLIVPVQDGMEPDHVRWVVDAGHGLFVGGSTEWKLATLPTWGDFRRETGCYLHVGRVNSARRIRLCADAGADSIDGTSVAQFPCTLERLDRAVRTANRQETIWNRLS